MTGQKQIVPNTVWSRFSFSIQKQDASLLLFADHFYDIGPYLCKEIHIFYIFLFCFAIGNGIIPLTFIMIISYKCPKLYIFYSNIETVRREPVFYRDILLNWFILAGSSHTLLGRTLAWYRTKLTLIKAQKMFFICFFLTMRKNSFITHVLATEQTSRDWC